MPELASTPALPYFQKIIHRFRGGHDYHQLATTPGDVPSRSSGLSALACKIILSVTLLLLASLAVCSAVLFAQKVQHSDSGRNSGHWVDTWSAVPQAMDVSFLPPSFVGDGVSLANSTIRQTLQISVGSPHIRIRISNAFGKNDLPIEKVRVGLALPQNGHYLGSGLVDEQTIKLVTFSGSGWLIIPDGALAVSDPIEFSPALAPGSVLSISMHVREGQEGEYITSHILSMTTSWLAPDDQTEAKELQNTNTNPHWFFIATVEAWRDMGADAFVILGDSITDGRGASHMNRNSRWPSFLFRRMQATSGLQEIGIANQGVGGNQVLHDGRGPNAASRVDRDLLSQSGLKYAMLFEGVNDIGWAGATEAEQNYTEARLIHYYKQIITRVHAVGVPIFGGTITPFECSDSEANFLIHPLREQTRQSVNQWIRTSGWFDAVVDFDEMLRDPTNHTRMTTRFSSPDCIHPNEVGYKEMADKFPLELFEKFRNGVDTFVK